jgi:hypothetical protein
MHTTLPAVRIRPGAGVIAFAFVAVASACDSGEQNLSQAGDFAPEYVCHASSPGQWVVNPTSSPGAANGHMDHSLDIIPPFRFQGEDLSLNWDSEGQAIWNNGCAAPEPPEPTPAPTPAPTEPPATTTTEPPTTTTEPATTTTEEATTTTEGSGGGEGGDTTTPSTEESTSTTEGSGGGEGGDTTTPSTEEST